MFGFLGVVWTLLLAVSLGLSWQLLQRGAFELATDEARGHLAEDLAYRKWAMQHGDVDVPVTPESPPDPMLAGVPERDVRTPSGRQLTLRNPGHRARWMFDTVGEKTGRRARLISLKPGGPESAPDEWEAAAFRAFATGVPEVGSVVDLAGQPYYRLMRPLVAEAGCLKCHAGQGYRLGEVSGGISVATPLSPHRAVARTQFIRLAGGHALFWGLGLVAIGAGYRQAGRRWAERHRAEQQLRESEHRYRSLFDSSRDALMTLAPPSWDFTSGNPATVQMFGTKDEAHFVSLAPWQLSPARQPDGQLSIEKAKAMIATAMREGSHFFDWTHQRINGQTFPATVLLTRLGLGGQSLLQATVRDVTAEKQAEAILRESNEALCEAQQLAHVGSWTLDLAKNHLLWSEEIYRIFEIDPRQFPASYEAFLAAVHPDDRDKVNQTYTASVRDRTAYAIEHRLRMPDGRIKFVQEQGRTDYDAHGQPLRSFGTVQDITERKEAETALRDSEARYRTLIESMGEGIGLVDKDERFVLANPAGERIFGVAPGGLCGRGLREFCAPGEFDRILDQSGRRQEGEKSTYELAIRRPDGQTRTLLVTAVPQFDRERKFAASLGVFLDVTDRKREEAEREQLIAELQEALAQVRTLSGLIPICSGCKRIRDDQNFWHQVERYVAQRTGAKFIHGLCPDCTKKYFPGVDLKQNGATR
jgi:PAS domain S-box-containing protein